MSRILVQPAVWRVVLEGVMIPGVTKRLYLKWKGYELLEVTVLGDAALGSRAPGVEMKHEESALLCCLGGVHPYYGRRGEVDNATTVWGSQHDGDSSWREMTK